MKNLLIAGICLFVFVFLPDLLFSVQEDTADTLYIDGFAIDKAFLQELKDVIDYDSTDFLTYELNYYNDILKNEPRLDELRSKKDRHLSEYDVYYNNEEFEKALTSYKLYLTYKDSINTILNARNVTDLNEQYNTVEKQNNIKILNRENQLKSLDLDKRKQLRWILYITSVFLFLFLVFTLNFVRLKFIKKESSIRKQ